MGLLDEAKALKDKLVGHRRVLHENAEVHMELPKTTAYVMARLREMGYEPEEICESGVVAIAGNKPGKTFLIRADMDALPIAEQSGVAFGSKTENMHACGHDMHTAMLLGAAQLLKSHENEIEGRIKLMFQPAEETLCGAMAMIKAGLLENPKVDAALMLHTLPRTNVPVGHMVAYSHGVVSSASDWFKVSVQGKGSHGARPNEGVDPINVLVHIFLAMQEVNAREIAPDEPLSFTVGQIHAGNTSNVIPDTAFMAGTIRTFSDKTRQFVKARLVEICKSVANTYRAEAEVEYTYGCPSVVIDKGVNDQVVGFLGELLGEDKVTDMQKATGSPRSAGSEDFGCVCEFVPGTRLSIPSGTIDDGYVYPSHHPKITFDENALPVGAAVYAHCAMQWLRSNR
jgi:hippurate hydrolase